jgi:phosphoglycerol transferase MdoB-like AlkP superfamily enzyme
MAIPMLVLLPALWIKGEWYRHFMRVYTWVLLFISSAIIKIDTELYSYWGFRMDYTPMLYLKTPKEVAASVSTPTVILTFIGIIALGTVSGLLYNRFIDKRFSLPRLNRYRVPFTFIFAIILGSLIIPVRGGFGVAPINAGTVYFSDKIFVNHSAINLVWNVGNSLFHRKPTKNPYVFGEMDEAVAIADSLTACSGSPEKVLNNTRPNILFIILESFGSSLVGPLGEDPLTTPNLNRLIGEGLVFSNFYASGNRTDKALPAILNAYPAQPAVSIIKEPRKTQSMNSIVKMMNGLNYNTSFWYGGDINFANFNSFLISSGFRQIITMDNFNPSDYNSKWGVHDHVFLKALQDSMASIKEPFFRVALTLSSHEPFEVPMDPVFAGKDDLTKFKI